MICVERLFKRFGSMEVLRGASMSVAKGEVAALIGASGSGKSTFLRCLNGLEMFDAGSVEVSGEKLGGGVGGTAPTALSHLRRRVGMVFQQFNLFPHMSVLQNVMSGPLHVLGLSRGEAAARAEKLLARVGMADFVDRRPGMLSGGQQQRVAIARALANEPDVILFDEPTSALDPKMTGEVLSVMADLAADGQTMLVVSHAMEFVRRTAHRVHVFVQGEIVESGPPAQVFGEGAHALTRELLEH
ncbi:MAG TPA: amino acid ABC transporter ATP-binding protein [Phycisphaerae bacterium]|nr:amino acid ABC transporter ATP-binding protein [Phycisphaerae bacterium]